MRLSSLRFALVALALSGVACSSPPDEATCRTACGNMLSIVTEKAAGGLTGLGPDGLALVREGLVRQREALVGRCVSECREAGEPESVACLGAAGTPEELRACGQAE